MRKSDSTVMDFYSFLDGIELLAIKIYKKEKLSESVDSFLREATSYFESLQK